MSKNSPVITYSPASPLKTKNQNVEVPKDRGSNRYSILVNQGNRPITANQGLAVSNRNSNMDQTMRSTYGGAWAGNTMNRLGNASRRASYVKKEKKQEKFLQEKQKKMEKLAFDTRVVLEKKIEYCEVQRKAKDLKHAILLMAGIVLTMWGNSDIVCEFGIYPPIVQKVRSINSLLCLFYIYYIIRHYSAVLQIRK